MLRFTVKVVNAREVDLAFGGLVAKIRDWRALWPQVMNLLHDIERRQFMTRGMAGGSGAWAGYKHTYGPDKVEGETASLRSSASLGRQYEGKLSGRGSKKIGREFGAKKAFEVDRLYNSLAYKTEDTVEVSEPLRMKFGTLVPYAYWHQTGTTRGLPARRILDLTQGNVDEIRRATQREAVNFSRRLGFKVISAAGGDVSQFSLAQIRQAGVQALNSGTAVPLN